MVLASALVTVASPPLFDLTHPRPLARAGITMVQTMAMAGSHQASWMWVLGGTCKEHRGRRCNWGRLACKAQGMQFCIRKICDRLINSASHAICPNMPPTKRVKQGIKRDARMQSGRYGFDEEAAGGLAGRGIVANNPAFKAHPQAQARREAP